MDKVICQATIKIIIYCFSNVMRLYIYLPFKKFQILFYNWTGVQNCFKIQPLDLIHEYLGDRVRDLFIFLLLFIYWLSITINGIIS